MQPHCSSWNFASGIPRQRTSPGALWRCSAGPGNTSIGFNFVKKFIKFYHFYNASSPFLPTKVVLLQVEDNLEEVGHWVSGLGMALVKDVVVVDRVFHVCQFQRLLSLVDNFFIF